MRIKHKPRAGFMLEEIYAGAHVLEDFDVQDKWKNFHSNMVCAY